MRKSLIYALTAAAMTAAGAAAPMTAQAAVNTYTLPGGNGQAIVISGNLNSFNCENGFPGIHAALRRAGPASGVRASCCRRSLRCRMAQHPSSP